MVKNKLKLYAVGEVTFLITLALVSTSAAGHINPPPVWMDCIHDVRVDELIFYDFGDPFFEIYGRIHNYEPYDINVTIRHIMIYPDGTEEQQSWYQGTLFGYQFIDFWIFCWYITNQTGKYTWVITVTEDNTGVLLDERAITWEREPIPTLKE